MAPAAPRLALYNYWRSSCSWRVRIGLHLKGLAFEYRVVNLIEGEHHGDAHRARSPLAQVPVLEVEEGGRTHLLPQSLAILEWLEERFPSPRLLPEDAYGRARVRAP
jgi:maleylpyruvate isomerase